MAMKLTKKSWTIMASAAATVFVFGSLFQNCSSPELEAGSAGLNSTSSTKFAIVPSTADIMVNGQQTFAITGEGPFTWSLSPDTCGGFDTGTKTFTAAAVGGITCTLSMKDRNSKVVRAVINIAETPLLATYFPNPATLSTNIQIQASGGTAPYTYSLVNGGGQLVSSQYKSPDVAETATIRVTDTGGKTYDVVIPVGGGGSTDTGGSGTVPIFRMVSGLNGDIMMSKQQGEGAAFQYTEQAAGKVTLFSTGSSNRAEIHRCFVNARHQVSLGVCTAGQEMLLGHVAKSSGSGATRQIFICSNGFSTFLSTNSAECGGSARAVGFVP